MPAKHQMYADMQRAEVSRSNETAVSSMKSWKVEHVVVL